MRYPDGSTYSGGWLIGLKHGFGTMRETDGFRTEGSFQYGLQHGECRQFLPKRLCCRTRRVNFEFGRECSLLIKKELTNLIEMISAPLFPIGLLLLLIAPTVGVIIFTIDISIILAL